MIDRNFLIYLAKRLAMASHSTSVYCESTRNKTFPWTSTECYSEFEKIRKCTMLEF